MSDRGPIIEAIHYRVVRLRRIPRHGLSTRVAIEIVAIVYATAGLLAALILLGG
jgi:hypothetical protein